MLKKYLKKGRIMTVCIAALAKEKDKKFIVFATDHMLTRDSLGEFETEFKKHFIFENNVLMLSGVPNYFEEIKKAFVSGESCTEQSNNIYNGLVKIKKTEIERRILSRYNIDFEEFKGFIQNGIDTSLVQFLQGEIAKFKLNVSLILSGFDANEPKCFVISEFGISAETEIGYCSIGEGVLQAINTLMFTQQNPEKELKETLYNVCRARKNSEVAIGVGASTDIGMLDSKGKSKILSLEEINSLNGIYEREKNHWTTERCLSNLVNGWIDDR